MVNYIVFHGSEMLSLPIQFEQMSAIHVVVKNA